MHYAQGQPQQTVGKGVRTFPPSNASAIKYTNYALTWFHIQFKSLNSHNVLLIPISLLPTTSLTLCYKDLKSILIIISKGFKWILDDPSSHYLIEEKCMFPVSSSYDWKWKPTSIYTNLTLTQKTSLRFSLSANPYEDIYCGY